MATTIAQHGWRIVMRLRLFSFQKQHVAAVVMHNNRMLCSSDLARFSVFYRASASVQLRSYVGAQSIYFLGITSNNVCSFNRMFCPSFARVHKVEVQRRNASRTRPRCSWYWRAWLAGVYCLLTVPAHIMAPMSIMVGDCPPDSYPGQTFTSASTHTSW